MRFSGNVGKELNQLISMMNSEDGDRRGAAVKVNNLPESPI